MPEIIIPIVTRSLDALLSDGETPFVDTIPDERDIEAEIVDAIDTERISGVLWQAVDGLPREQARLLHLHYEGDMTISAAAERMGISSGRARTTEQNALRKLRQNQKLKAYARDWIFNEAIKGVGAEKFKRTFTSATERTALMMIESEEISYEGTEQI